MLDDGWTTTDDDGRRADGRRTNDGPWLYYKLTNEPKGSGELKIDDYWNPQSHALLMFQLYLTNPASTI